MKEIDFDNVISAKTYLDDSLFIKIYRSDDDTFSFAATKLTKKYKNILAKKFYVCYGNFVNINLLNKLNINKISMDMAGKDDLLFVMRYHGKNEVFTILFEEDEFFNTLNLVDSKLKLDMLTKILLRNQDLWNYMEDYIKLNDDEKLYISLKSGITL